MAQRWWTMEVVAIELMRMVVNSGGCSYRVDEDVAEQWGLYSWGSMRMAEVLDINGASYEVDEGSTVVMMAAVVI